jgi:beta-lactamase regulating signal transducer with metallopeptidase domain
MTEATLLGAGLEVLVYGLGSSLTIVAAWFTTRALKRSSAGVRHLVWLGAFVALLLLPIGRAVMPHRQVVIAHRNTVWATNAGSFAPPEYLAVALPKTTVSPRDFSDDEIELPPQPAAPLMPAKSPQTSRLLPWIASILAAWLFGSVLFLAQIVAAMMRLSRLRTRPADDRGDDGAANWVSRIGVRLAWKLRVNKESAPTVAMTWGAIRPTVLLPEASVSWSERRLEAVMLHELAHVRRLDCASQLLAAILCALYWFNPLVWLGARAMRAEAESAADDLVLKSGIKPSAYAGELLRLAAELGRKRQPFMVVGVSIMKHSKIESRVVAILDSSRRRRGAGSLETIGVLVVALAAIVPLAVVKPAIAFDSSGPKVTRGQDLADSPAFAADQDDLSIAAVQPEGSASIQAQAEPNPQPTPSPTPHPQPKARPEPHPHPRPNPRPHIQSKANLKLGIKSPSPQARLSMRKKLGSLKMQVKARKLDLASKFDVLKLNDNALKLRMQTALDLKLSTLSNLRVDKQLALKLNLKDLAVLKSIDLKESTILQKIAKDAELKSPQKLDVLTLSADKLLENSKTLRALNLQQNNSLDKLRARADVIRSDNLLSRQAQIERATELLKSRLDLHRQRSTMDQVRLNLLKDRLSRLSSPGKLSMDQVRVDFLRDRLSGLSAPGRISMAKSTSLELQLARQNLDMAIRMMEDQAKKLKGGQGQKSGFERVRRELEDARRELEKASQGRHE